MLAEDLSLKALHQLWRHREGLNADGTRRFLFVTARRMLLNHRDSERARKERERRWSEESPRLPALPDAVLEAGRKRERLARAVGSLSERRREAFILVFVEGLPYKETARKMGLSPRTVERHVASAILDLRNALRLPVPPGEGEAHAS